MYHDTTDLIILCVLGACMVLALGLLALLMLVVAPYEIMRSTAADGTRKGVKIAAACWCVVAALIGAFVGFMVFEMFLRDYLYHGYGYGYGYGAESQLADPETMEWCVVIAGGVLLALVQALICAEMYKMLEGEIKRQLELAPQAAKYAIDHFADFDRNGDKIITKSEVDDVEDKDGDELFCQVRDHFEEFGHVIGHHSETRTTFIYTGKVMVPITQRVVVDDYGINLNDLKTYPARIAETYKHW